MMTTLSARNYSLEEMDKQCLFHPLTSVADHLKSGPLIVSDGHGVRVKDRNGRDLLDCAAGLWCVNIGYGRPEIAEAAAEAIRNLSYYHLFGSASNEPTIRLADRVLTLFREKAGAGISPEYSSAPRVRMPTTPTSSWSVITIISSAARRRRKSSPASAPIMA